MKSIVLSICSLVFFVGKIFCQTDEHGTELKYNENYIGGVNEVFESEYFSALFDMNPTYSVSSADQLLDALNNAKTGELIYIISGSSIDLSNRKEIKVQGGVTIYGDRGKNGDEGPLIFTDSHGVHPLFEVVGDNVTFFGLRIRGADGKRFHGKDAFEGKSKKEQRERYLELYHQNMYSTPVSSGIATNNDNLRIENCELYHWTYTAIYLRKGATNATVQYSFIHDNLRFGLGYGITVDRSVALIEANLFNNNGHSISSPGRPGSIYTATHNIFMEGGNSFSAVDMHGGKDRDDGTNIAGTKINVSSNTFYIGKNGRAVLIRGRSEEESIVENNKIISLDKSNPNIKKFVDQVNSQGNIRKRNNTVIIRGN